jgi:hypothetical protein
MRTGTRIRLSARFAHTAAGDQFGPGGQWPSRSPTNPERQPATGCLHRRAHLDHVLHRLRGAYGLEDEVGKSGAGMGLFLILVTPLLWSLPAALMVAEPATAS